MEVLLGNDGSTDSTGRQMDKFAKGKDWVRVFHIDEGKPKKGLIGKAKVLDTLAKNAQGGYLFFTDADIVLSSVWIEGMLGHFKENVGVVIGVTGFRTNSLFGKLQSTEWLMALSIFKIAADFKIPSTGLGNNMAVSKKAYDAIGGYESLGFSIVEDYQLYMSIIKAGFAFEHAFEPKVLAYTVPPENYFKQRKRWIKGAIENSPWAMVGGFLQALSIPIFILLGFFSLKIPLFLSAFLFLIYFGLICYFEQKLKLKGYLFYLPAFMIYISVSWFLQVLYYAFSKKTTWKGRAY